MSNATRSRTTAARYAALAGRTADAEIRAVYLELERLWMRIAALAEEFERSRDGAARHRIYEMMDEVGRRRQAVS